MNLLRQTVVCGALSLVVGVRGVRAQSAGGAGSDPHRWAVAIAADGAVVPDAYSLRCGDGDGVQALGGGIAALFRPRSWLVLEGDTRASVVPGIGCHILIPPGPPGYFTPFTQYDGSTPAMPLIRSAMRVGVETPAGWPMLRATVGGGVIWTKSSKPFATAAIGASSRREGARLFAELEANMSRVSGTRVEPVPGPESMGYPMLIPRFTPRVESLTWATLHFGVEFPVAR